MYLDNHRINSKYSPKSDQDPNNSQFRVKFLIFCFISISFIYSGKILLSATKINYSFTQPKKLFTESKSKPRAEIFDRNGTLIATNLPVSSLAMNPLKIRDKKDAESKLKKAFPEISLAELKSKLNSDKKFLWVKRGITPKEDSILAHDGIFGLIFEDDYARIYPQGSSLAFLLGYVDTDHHGIAGLERTFESKLQDPNSKIEITIDSRLQNLVVNALARQINETHAIGGSGIIMDVTNGEILALASLPTFDPHKAKNPNNVELFNRATLGVYELGSVFKPLTMAYLLDADIIKITDTFDVSSLKIGKYSIGDFTPSNSHRMDIETILVKSSNIGTAKAAMKGGTKLIQEYFTKFGLNNPLNIELPEKSHPIFPKKWAEINLVTASYGHGIAVTPLHFAAAFAGIVNKGQKCEPHLELGVVPICKSVIKPAVSLIINKMLRSVVVKGSGRRAEVPGLCLGGKTGTGVKLIKGRYSKTDSITSFVGAFPIYDPKYLISINIDSPKGTRLATTGGAVAAPVAKEIAEEMSRVLGLKIEPEKCFS